MIVIQAAKTEYQDAINKAVEILASGGLIVYPTETCYGVGVDATNPLAIKKLLDYKHRPEGKAISIAVTDKEMAEQFVELNPIALNIYTKFLPGPVTVISMGKSNLAPGLQAENGSLGVRIPDYQMTLDLIKKFGKPITATSANSSGKKTPYNLNDLMENLTIKQKQLLDLVLDAGELPHNPPSTVIDTTKEDLKILRRGDINFGQMLVSETIQSEEAMREQGVMLIKRFNNLLAKKALLIMFNADLGAGKTQLIKGIAEELRIKAVVNSPTFVLLKEYPFEYNGIFGQLIHLDAWRLESLTEMDALNLQQYFQPGNIIAVEWAGMAKEYLESISSRDDVFKVYIEIEYSSLTERKLNIYE